MKKKTLFQLFGLTLLAASLSLTSCKKDDDDDTQPQATESGYYTLGISAGGVSYLVPSNSTTSGSVNLDNAIEINGFESRAHGNYIYTFVRADKKMYQYEMKEGGVIEEKASILLTPYITDRAYSRTIVDGNTLVIIDPITWGEPEVKWVQISIPDFNVTGSGTLTLPTVEQTPGTNWSVNVGKVVKHGDKLIMGTIYYDFDGNYLEGSDAIVIDYPSMTNPTRISTDKIDGELGIISNSTYAHTENGDTYLATAGGFSNGSPLWGKAISTSTNGGILRIKNGETSFDDNYLLDLTAELGTPTNIMNLHYVGNDIAIAMIFNPNDIADWGDLDNDRYQFAKIKLSTGEVTVYNNIPKSGSKNGRVAAIDGSKYINFIKSVSQNKTNILTINTDTDEATIGTEVSGDDVSGYMITKYTK